MKQRIVIKVGSNVLTREDGKLNVTRMSAIVDQAHEMGVTACQLLLKNIQGDMKVYKKIVPQQLVIRDTSAKKIK